MALTQVGMAPRLARSKVLWEAYSVFGGVHTLPICFY